MNKSGNTIQIITQMKNNLILFYPYIILTEQAFALQYRIRCTLENAQ